jgi:hypothetical protein
MQTKNKELTRKTNEIIKIPERWNRNNTMEPSITPDSSNMRVGHLVTIQPILENEQLPEERLNQFPTNGTKMLRSQAIVIPTYAGKYSERPNQFLIRIQEYAETVHGWDRSTLLLGIPQFLRDNALEWYCQLRASHRWPQTWSEFVDLFRFQFNCPIRNARQEQEWYDCKQREIFHLCNLIISAISSAIVFIVL